MSQIRNKKSKITKSLLMKDLINLIKKYESFNDLISTFETQSMKGHIFERVWDLVIKLGLCDYFPNHKYKHLIGNVNTAKPSEFQNLKLYLEEKVNNGNSSGVSDITLYNKEEDKYIFISSKYPKKKTDMKNQKDIKYYDIQNILAVIKQNDKIYKNSDIYLLVPDKNIVRDNISRCNQSSDYLIKNIKNIFDENDLARYYKILKTQIQGVEITDIPKIFNLNKESLLLRFHQNFMTHKTLLKIDEGAKNILWGWKCRAGKTYGIGGICLKYFQNYQKLNVLVITPAPTETIPQFTNDLFYKYRDFDKLNIIEIKSSVDLNCINLHKNNIIVVSKQLLDRHIEINTNKNIKNLKLDLIIFDENHFGGTTDNSQKILDSYASGNSVNIFLTATYHKTTHKWNIPIDCQFYWDIEDEQICKRRDISKLEKRHGQYINKFINEDNKEDLLRIYDNMPDLHIISTLMDQKRYEDIKNKIMDTKYGFSMDVLFSLDKKSKNFQFPNEVEKVLRYISGSNRLDDFKISGDKSIFSRIKNISNDKDSRTTLTNDNFTTQLWFLPFGFGMTIDKVSECLKVKINNDKELANFETLIINSKTDYKIKDLKSEINRKEIEAKEAGKRGLILLAGNQCSLGITLPLVDVVMLLNNTMSSDKILQMMYRSMSETPDGSKKIGFVVDLNISRVLQTFLEYNVNNKDLNVEQKIEYVIANNLINIDNDLLDNQENKTQIVEKLVSEWKKDPINNFKRLLKKIENHIIEIDSEDQRLINKAFVHTTNDGKCTLHKMDEDIEQELPSGKTKTKNNTSNDEEAYKNQTDSDTEEEIETENISFSKEVLPFIIPLVCILTMKEENKDIIDMINIIKENEELLEVFNEQSFIWWNKKEIIDFIKNIISKYLKKNSEAYSMAVQFKMELKSLIDEPEKLLKLIDSCLKPKQKEKQENGEVFTPMNLIEEMLDVLDKNYQKKHKKSIFTNEKLKWYDPANGMGNFPIAVYLRLMKGLKKEIPNKIDRKKHILENMIYMSELNKKNNFITKQIFDTSEFNINLYEGDSLKLNPEEVWHVKKFDVILGNPPYNKGGIRSHTGKQLKKGTKTETLWPLFISKYMKHLKKDGYLVFITPLSWLKKSHSLHDEMLDKHIVWLKLWDNSQSKKMINADIPISLFIVKNKINVLSKRTEIISVLKRRNLTTSSKVYLNPVYTIPLAFHNIFDKLINFIENKDCKLEYKTKTIKSSGKNVKIPEEYTIDDMLAVDTYTIKEGIKVKKTKEKHPDANKRKLIIANKSSFRGAFIDEGKLGMTGSDKIYIIGNNLEIIKKMLSFKISNIIAHYTKYRQDFLEKEAFKYIPDIRKLGIDDINEDDFYHLLELTKDEIKEIKKQ